MTQVFVNVWLILSIVLQFVIFTSSSSIQRSGYATFHSIFLLLIFAFDIFIIFFFDPFSQFEQGQAQLDACDNNSRHYQLKTHPIENYSNDAEIGQQLIDLLLRTGEIEEKSTIQSLDSETQNRHRNDMISSSVKSDRYDELLAAFNVILEEILRQGDSRLPNSDAHTYRDLENGLNQLQNDYALSGMHVDGLELKYRQQSKCNKNGADAMKRCLNPFEGELLRKIKALNQQLNSFMHMSNNDKIRRKRDTKKRDEFSSFTEHRGKNGNMMKHQTQDSDDWFERKAKQKAEQSNEWDLERLKHPLFEMPKSHEFFFVRNQPIIWEEKHFKFLEDPPETPHEEFSHEIKKREVSLSPEEPQNNTKTETEIDSENVLNKENNFGMELQKFISYLEDGLEKLENPQPTVNGSKDESTESHNNIEPNGTDQKNKVSMKLNIQIPMRLVKKSDGRIYLVVDRRKCCRRSRINRPTSK